MPNIKSAKKRVQVTKAKRLSNQTARTALKTSMKKFSAAFDKTEGTEREDAFRAAVKTIDKAVARGLIHKNTASRKKSALALKLAAVKKADA